MAESASELQRGAPIASDLTGTTVGRFAIHARLGQGGMGEVYRADDTKLKRLVALKRMAPRLQSDGVYRHRFLREAQYASALTDQHIASIYDVLEANNEIFLVMEYVEGKTLRQRLAKPLSIEQFLEIAVQCAAALTAAHQRGIAHLDIKPENIMLTEAGQVKILDFGVAKQLPRLDDVVTMETLAAEGGSGAGTPAYMAPEVLLEKAADHRADIFSLGVVFYEALTGRHPFRAAGVLGTSNRILHEAPTPLRQVNPKVPAELERIVAKMLAKNPAERYSTAADLLVDLRAVQRGWALPGRAAAAPRVLLAPRRKTEWWALAAVGVLLLVVVGSLPQVRRQFHWFSRSAVAVPKNLAVLPFQAIGGGPENQAYSDGMTETLTAKLTQLTATHQLQVVPAHDVRARQVMGAKEARKELGVSLVLEGTLHRSGKTVRVNYALVDTGTLRQLRADTITAEASDPFAVQDQVAAGLVRMLELELKPQEQQVLRTYGTQVAGAYDFYLQGRGYLQNYDRLENIENSINLFQRALRFDPNYAFAYAGLGEAYWKKYESSKDSRWVEDSRQACQRALSLDSKLAAAHICMGTVGNGTGRYEQAASEFERALDSEPTSDDAYRGLAFAFQRMGKPAEAERTYRRAIELRPHYWASYSWLGVFYYHQARYQEAAEMFNQVVALVPDSIRGYYNLGATYVEQGQYAEAIAVLERSIAIRPTDYGYTNLGNAHFFLRQYEQAARAYEQAVKFTERDPLLWWNLGDGYYWAPGRRAQAAGAYRQGIVLAKEELRVNPQDPHAFGILAICHAMLGEKKPALDSLRQGLQLSPGDPYLRFQAALVHNQFGEPDQTIEWLKKALAAGYSPSRIRDLPNFDALRANPRFQELPRAK